MAAICIVIIELLFCFRQCQIEDLKTDGDEYVVRRLSASKGSESREIIHLHYTKWPDKFIPKCKDSILYMLETIRTFQPLEKQDPPPLLVHCRQE